MGTTKETAAHIVEQLQPLDVRTRPMFGEYALYCSDKVVGFICDNRLLMKITEVSPEFAADLPLGRPYPEAKDYHAIPPERLEDTAWLHAFVQRTADVVPKPKPKKRKG